MFSTLRLRICLDFIETEFLHNSKWYSNELYDAHQRAWGYIYSVPRVNGRKPIPLRTIRPAAIYLPYSQRAISSHHTRRIMSKKHTNQLFSMHWHNMMSNCRKHLSDTAKCD